MSHFYSFSHLRNPTQVLAGMIKRLDGHNKELRHDAAELMEVCEALEFDNRRMSREALVST